MFSCSFAGDVSFAACLNPTDAWLTIRFICRRCDWLDMGDGSGARVVAVGGLGDQQMRVWSLVPSDEAKQEGEAEEGEGPGEGERGGDEGSLIETMSLSLRRKGIWVRPGEELRV